MLDYFLEEKLFFTNDFGGLRASRYLAKLGEVFPEEGLLVDDVRHGLTEDGGDGRELLPRHRPLHPPCTDQVTRYYRGSLQSDSTL